MNSIVVFSQGISTQREQLPVSELGAEAELAAARQVAEELGGMFRQVGKTLVIDGLDGSDQSKITTICRSHKLTWMANRSLLTGQPLY